MHTSRCLKAQGAVPTVLVGADRPRWGMLFGGNTVRAVEASERFGVVVACMAPFVLYAFRQPPTDTELGTDWTSGSVAPDNEKAPEVIPFGATSPTRVLFAGKRWCMAVGALASEVGDWRRPVLWVDDLSPLDATKDSE